MDLLANSKIDFMKFSRFFVPVSIVVLIASSVFLATGTLNLGIDFAGGTQLIVKFRETPEVDTLREVLDAEGFEDAPRIQRFGEEEDNEAIIKTRLAEGEAEGSRDRVVGALDRRFNGGSTAALDVNQQGRAAISGFLFERDPDGEKILGDADARRHYDNVASAVMELRRQEGLVSSWDEIEALPDTSSEVSEALRSGARLGAFTVLSAENVGPQIGSELRTKGILAVVFSLLGMLAYITWRFEFRFGIGALAALVHDVVIALGFYMLLDYEFDLTTIAAFLTLVGYSVNDSVVIFDRVRENLRQSRRDSLTDTVNRSLNQTLSRTLLTSSTTMLAVGTMYTFGGDVLRGFSFVLLVGVAIGTYSSMFVASPVVILWDRFRTRRR